MLEPIAAVIIWEPADPVANTPAAWCCVGHNLDRFDAERLRDRLAKQYDLSAHLVLHRNRHDAEPSAMECSICMLLMEEIVEKAAIFARSKEANRV